MSKSLDYLQVLSVLNNQFHLTLLCCLYRTPQSSMPVNLVLQTESNSFSHTSLAADVHEQVQYHARAGMGSVAKMLAACPRMAA